MLGLQLIHVRLIIAVLSFYCLDGYFKFQTNCWSEKSYIVGVFRELVIIYSLNLPPIPQFPFDIATVLTAVLIGFVEPSVKRDWCRWRQMYERDIYWELLYFLQTL